jgi:hypothetical protein
MNRVKNPIAGRCCASVSAGPRTFYFHQCERPAKVTRDSYDYCAQHDPEAVKARRALSNAKYTAETRRLLQRGRRVQDYQKLRDTLRHVIGVAGTEHAMMALAQAQKLLKRIDKDEEKNE